MNEGDRVRITHPRAIHSLLVDRAGTVVDFPARTPLIAVDVDDYSIVYCFRDEIIKMPELEQKIDEIYNDRERR